MSILNPFSKLRRFHRNAFMEMAAIEGERKGATGEPIETDDLLRFWLGKRGYGDERQKIVNDISSKLSGFGYEQELREFFIKATEGDVEKIEKNLKIAREAFATADRNYYLKRFVVMELIRRELGEEAAKEYFEAVMMGYTDIGNP